MTDALGIETCSCTDTLRERHVAEKAHPDGGGRGVGNAHLAKAEDAGAFGVADIN